MNERERIELLSGLFGHPKGEGDVGIGDDAAVLALPQTSLVWTVDAQVEGTHFELDWLSWEDVGYRSFMAAASDLAAMGAAPRAALSSLVLAPSVDDDALASLARGQAMASAEVSAPVVGGNLARGRESSVTTTLLGHAHRPVLRSGARPGDMLLVAGALGLAAAGLRWLSRHGQERAPAVVEQALAAWRRPRARIDDGLRLAEAAARGEAHAAVDVSDGLACDVAHLARASAVDVVLDAEALVRHAGEALARAADAVGAKALDLALYGGEDYALVVASAHPIDGFVTIGTVEACKQTGRETVHLRTEAGIAPLAPGGFDHFATSP